MLELGHSTLLIDSTIYEQTYSFLQSKNHQKMYQIYLQNVEFIMFPTKRITAQLCFQNSYSPHLLSYLHIVHIPQEQHHYCQFSLHRWYPTEK
jgi:hypothetical protein